VYQRNPAIVVMLVIFPPSCQRGGRERINMQAQRDVDAPAHCIQYRDSQRDCLSALRGLQQEQRLDLRSYCRGLAGVVVGDFHLRWLSER
jgi:hypothetical protein